MEGTAEQGHGKETTKGAMSEAKAFEYIIVGVLAILVGAVLFLALAGLVFILREVRP